MARCNCGILPNIAIDPDSALTMTGSGTTGDPLILGNRPAPMGQVQFFTAGAHTWDKADYPGVQWIRVRVVGGGGGSAGATAGAALGVARGGGAGGNYAESWLDVDPLPASVAITVGAGGAAGAAANGAGGDGGTSTFGGLVSAGGGGGSPAVTAPLAAYVVSPGGVNGGGNIGNVSIFGGNGQPGIQFNATQRMAGAGGMSGNGMGSMGQTNTDLSGGNVGRAWGGGASGPAVYNGSNAGSAGGVGIVVVEMFR